MKPTVTISKEEYEELLEDQLFLSCLERAGVSQWEKYDNAIEMCIAEED